MSFLLSFWRFLAPFVVEYLRAKYQDRKTRPFMLVGAMLCATAATASAANVGGELYRTSINERRINEMHPPLRPKVRAIITDLEGHNEKPLISEAYRTPARQRELLKQRVTTVQWGYHCAATRDGKPDALAADIVAFPAYWDAPRSFWMKLASSAVNHDMGTGSRWFGHSKSSQRNLTNFDKALAARNWNYTGPIGWDVPHVETKGVSIAAARAGKRPK